MKQLTKSQAYIAMLLLMISVIIVDELFQSVLGGSVRTSVVVFPFFMCIFWIMEHAGLAKWPKTTLVHKMIMAGAAAVTPLVLHLIRS